MKNLSLLAEIKRPRPTRWWPQTAELPVSRQLSERYPTLHK